MEPPAPLEIEQTGFAISVSTSKNLTMEWIVTEADRKRLRSLEDFASEDNKEVLRRIGAKKKVSLDDIDAIKNALPKDAPLFLFLNNLTIHHEDVIYKASAEFRAKTEALRRKQENMAYKKIVQSVDASQKYGKVDHMENFGAELRAVNRQLINIFNIMLTVVCAFFFGFTGVQFAYPHLHLDIATRFMIGLIPATIVFFADLYFVIKNMEEDDDKDSRPSVLSFKEMAEKSE
ncbi:hypothetical protein TELCIR_10634 [Teladorsagia circumcincta]|uniref:Transmembrane protein 199 n=1 Tax=Teladorsagia circumcincta TaxID=45464 RepID=A0A2G9UBK5_TELCI|nr:hypothetical protein TELCIR_10634 [Teladorsagia circumcincta]